MPVFDLQVIQTHDAGLARLRTAIDATLTRSTAVGRRRRAIMNRLFRDPTAYLDTYLGAEGYLARAARFDYPPPTAEGSVFPPEFWSLVALVNYSARTFPQRVAPWRLPGRALALARRRFLEGANR
jgi:hypothetical protein